jgi:hypothetical protein
MIWLLLHPLTPHGKTEKERQPDYDTGDGGGAKSSDGEKAWSSINHSILSGCISPGGGGPKEMSSILYHERLAISD